MVAAPIQLDADSLVARIIEELRANPDAQTLLLRALLTDEFLGMPLRLERVEAGIDDLKVDVEYLKTVTTRLETDTASLKADTASLKTTVASLKGDNLEVKLHKRARSLISQRLGLRKARMMTSVIQGEDPGLSEPVDNALANGVITDAQEGRIAETDMIFRARLRTDGSLVWIVVEVSNTIDSSDIQRVRQTADALSAVFQQDALSAVIGYRIHPRDQERADDAGVRTIIVPERD